MQLQWCVECGQPLALHERLGVMRLISSVLATDCPIGFRPYCHVCVNKDGRDNNDEGSDPDALGDWLDTML